MAYLVIGSGPSGIACAQALLSRGLQVILIDGGITLEAERQAMVQQLAQSSPDKWNAVQLGAWKEKMESTSRGIPLKRVFGSDFPYQEVDRHLPVQGDAIGFQASLALGGFSNVWGSAMLPYTESDLQDWGITLQQLAPHYEKVVELVGLSGQQDALAETFPLFVSTPDRLSSSRQIEPLLKRTRQHQSGLKKKGIVTGASRLAVKGQTNSGQGCIYCGMCMYGCPYGFIYNSAASVEQFRSNPLFSYRPNAIVRKVGEDGSGAWIEGYDRISGEKIYFSGDRVFLGAGVLGSSRILLESAGAINQPVVIKDSQYFLFPLILMKGGSNVRSEALHTLSQMFLEINDPSISPRGVHLQLYSYNDLITPALRKSLGLLGQWDYLVRKLEDRLVIVQGYLHSDDSSRIEARLEPGNETMALKSSVHSNPRTRLVIHKIMRKLMVYAGKIGAWPIPFMLQMGMPGRGYHVGGSFPMAASPEKFETDLLGRPFGWQKVHVIDSTVFPTIPATTITFSVMANAHRIGTEAGK